MDVKLLRYDAALRAVALAKRPEEAKAVRNKAVAMEVYARKAKDRELLNGAIDIRLEAERKAGKLLIDMAESGERAKRGDAQKFHRATFRLRDLKISKTESHRWQSLAKLPVDKFTRRKNNTKRIAVATLEGNKEIVTAARVQRHLEKRAQRAVRERTLGDKQLALPAERFGVILADPEWRFEFYSELGKTNSSADNHYRTSALDVIASRDIASIAADDCVLFLWATVPLLPEAIEVMRAWGFTYKSNVAWYKQRAGTGYWFRNKHEHLLVGTRGSVPAPAEGQQWDSVIEAPANKHSAKPERAHELIEHYFPTLPKIELNARGKARPGWSAWGLEAEADEPASQERHAVA